jgi:uncharacterized protein Yka (UPF0111/DUF47 family)
MCQQAYCTKTGKNYEKLIISFTSVNIYNQQVQEAFSGKVNQLERDADHDSILYRGYK